MNLNYDYNYQWNNGYDVLNEREKLVASDRKAFIEISSEKKQRRDRDNNRWNGGFGARAFARPVLNGAAV